MFCCFFRALDPLHWRPAAREQHVPKQPRPASKRKADAAKEQPAGAQKRSKKNPKGTAKAGRYEFIYTRNPLFMVSGHDDRPHNAAERERVIPNAK